MSYLKFAMVRSKVLCALACMTWVTFAATSVLAGTVGQQSEAGVSSTENAPPMHEFIPDDPVAVRDALATQNIDYESPSFGERIRKLIHIPGHKALHDHDAAQADFNRDLIFVVPVRDGVLYRSKTRLLTVDTDISGDDVPELIQLRKTVTGPSGRGLAVPAEAVAKGYIQHVDLIELQPGELRKTRVHGRVRLPHSAFSEADGNFSILLICNMTPPYFTDRHTHSAPTDDNATDITTRTSTLYADVRGVWLVNPRNGAVLSRSLRLSR